MWHAEGSEQSASWARRELPALAGKAFVSPASLPFEFAYLPGSGPFSNGIDSVFSWRSKDHGKPRSLLLSLRYYLFGRRSSTIPGNCQLLERRSSISALRFSHF